MDTEQFAVDGKVLTQQPFAEVTRGLVLRRHIRWGFKPFAVWALAPVLARRPWLAPKRLTRTLFFDAVLFAIGDAFTLASSVTIHADQPNVVLILCDDLGYADVGFNGATDIKTPALDRLAKDGAVFSSAYVCHPFCGPSRMGLMTGRYPHTFGAPFNLPNSGQGIEDYNRQGIPTSEVLVSEMLQASGYHTGAIGKWHLGIDAPFHPNARGFDEFYGFLGGGHMYFPEKYQPIFQRQSSNGIKHINEYVLPLEHNGETIVETEYMTDALSREAVRFVKDASETDKPFFLYVAYNAPHTPLEAKEDDLAVHADIKDDKRRTYAAMVHAVDRGVGDLVAALTETQSLDDTLMLTSVKAATLASSSPNWFAKWSGKPAFGVRRTCNPNGTTAKNPKHAGSRMACRTISRFSVTSSKGSARWCPAFRRPGRDEIGSSLDTNVGWPVI